MTLSTGYLEELSVRYRKQIEDLQLSSRQAHEALATAEKEREETKRRTEHLDKEVAALKESLAEISSQLETIGAWVSYRTALIFYTNV